MSASQAASVSRPFAVSAVRRMRRFPASGTRSMSPARSSAEMTSFIDCGVTHSRRASWALERPLRERRIDSVVYCATLSPFGPTSRPISLRTARSRRAMT